MMATQRCGARFRYQAHHGSGTVLGPQGGSKDEEDESGLGRSQSLWEFSPFRLWKSPQF